MRKPSDLAARIAERSVPEPNTGCWLWLGAISSGGYGHIRVDGRVKLAHRVSYEAHVGPIPDGLCACHKCDVRSCVNPAHIFLGTYQDNSDDAVSKGRQRVGAGCNLAKLDDAKVASIRSRYAAGESSAALAAEFELSANGIGSVLNGRTWKHVPGGAPLACRQPFGSRHGSAKMTEDIVSAARNRHSAGERTEDLAGEYGVSRAAMFSAISGRTWSHVAADGATGVCP